MSKRRICLDAGHYGRYNRSAVVPAFYESDFNWKFHLLLKKHLEQYGIEVTLTRDDKDTNRDLYERGRCAKGHDLFLSIHANWASRTSADYPVAYVPINGSGDVIGLKLAKCIAEVMGTTEAGCTKTKRSSKGPWDWYGVIYGAVEVGVPGIILEHSFYSNERSAKWLMDDSNLDKLARAEAAVIAVHYGLEKLADEDPVISDPSPAPTPVSKPEVKLAVDGKWGRGTTTRLQQIFGTTVDGEISNQWAKYRDSNPGLRSGWEWQQRPNGKGSQLIKAMQKWAGMPEDECDGEIGPKTIKAFQRKLGTTVDGYVSNPSQMVKALQRWANEQ